MKIKNIFSTIVSCLFVSTMSFANDIASNGEIKTLTDLMNNKSTLNQIKNVMSISDDEYDSLRKLVLATLVSDGIVNSNTYSFDQLGLGLNERFGLLIETKSGPYIKLFVSSKDVVVHSLAGGERFQKMFEKYINGYSEENRENNLKSKISIKLEHLIASLKIDYPNLILSLNLDDYEFFHDLNSILSGVIKHGENKGKEWGELKFKLKNPTNLAYPPQGISINTNGQIQFYPGVKLGLVKNENDSVKGTCVIFYSNCSMICEDNTNQNACITNQVFPETRCGSRPIWLQNIKCRDLNYHPFK